MTDFSSIFWDYFYLEKPVVFYRFDFDDYSLDSIDGKIMQEVKNLDKLFANCFYDETMTVKFIETITEKQFDSDNYENINKYFYN